MIIDRAVLIVLQDVANYNALNAASPDPITSGNSNYDENHYINALAPLLTQNSFPGKKLTWAIPYKYYVTDT